MNAIHPGHWFQGEYDLVYRWTGSPVIVDLKASVGANDRSGDYVEQLKIYAMLWYATHGRDEQVAGLQIWYLGHPSIKTVPMPTVEEMEAIETEMETLWRALKEGEPTLGDCLPDPRPMRGFSAGGQPAEPPNASRCDRCDWRLVCPGGEGTDDQQRPDDVQLPGASQRTPLQPIGGLDPRATVRGELFSVGYLKDGVPLKMTIKQGTNTAHIQVVSTKRSDGTPTVGVPAMKGQAVLVKDAVFTVNWKGEIVLKMDPFSELVADDDPDVESADLFDFSQTQRRRQGGLHLRKERYRQIRKPWSRKDCCSWTIPGRSKLKDGRTIGIINTPCWKSAMLWRWPTLDWMRGPVKCGLTTREIRGFKFSSVSTAQPPDEMVVTSNATACLSGVECGRTVPS